MGELEHINTIYLTQDLNNINQSLLVELYLQVDSIQTRSNELDSNRVLDAILTRELLNPHVLAPKTPLLKLITYEDLDQISETN